MKILYILRGWIFVRPFRYIRRHTYAPQGRFWWKRHEYMKGWLMPPDIHWYIIAKFWPRFCRWMEWDAWCKFCDWTGGRRQTYPLMARIVHKIGKIINNHEWECYHCASSEGCQCHLSDGEEFFEVTDSGTDATEDGTNHWCEGITTCPKCGFRANYRVDSL